MADFGTAFDKIAEIVAGTSLSIDEGLGLGTALRHAETFGELRGANKLTFALRLRSIGNETVQNARLTRKRQAVVDCEIFFPAATDTAALQRVLGGVFEAVADRLQNPSLWDQGTSGITSLTLAPTDDLTHARAEVEEREGGLSLVFPIPFTFRGTA